MQQHGLDAEGGCLEGVPFTAEVRRLCAEAALDIGAAVRAAVQALPYSQRSRMLPTPLKPGLAAVAALPDLVGEHAAFKRLSALAATTCCDVRVVVDPTSGLYHAIPVPPSLTTAAVPLSHINEGSGGVIPCEPLPASLPHDSHPTPSTSAVAAAEASTTTIAAPEGSPSQSAAPPPQRVMWVYLDAVDGTLKLSGLGNTPGRLRAANDGGWAVGIALTDPTTEQDLRHLRVQDFTVAAIVDGNPASCPACPTAAVAVAETAGSNLGGGSAAPVNPAVPLSVPDVGGQAAGLEEPPRHLLHSHASSDGVLRFTTRDGRGRLLHTSSGTTLSQSFAYLDAFQAFDHHTATPGDAALACQLYACLMDRHNGGAFDVLRTYGNLSSLLRTMLAHRGGDATSVTADGGDGLGASSDSSATPGEKDAAVAAEEDGASQLWWEPACGVFIAVNENLANLLPCVAVVVGAGGVATDLEGRPLLGRRLGEGRTSVLYAANATLHAAALRVVLTAATAAGKAALC